MGFEPTLEPSADTVTLLTDFIAKNGANTEVAGGRQVETKAPAEESDGRRIAAKPKAAKTEDGEPEWESQFEVNVDDDFDEDDEQQLQTAETDEDETDEEEEPAASDDDDEISTILGLSEEFGLEEEDFLGRINVEMGEDSFLTLGEVVEQAKNVPAEAEAYRLHNGHFEDYTARKTELEKTMGDTVNDLMLHATTMAKMLVPNEPDWQKMSADGMDATQIFALQKQRTQSIAYIHRTMGEVQTASEAMAAQTLSDQKERRLASYAQVKTMLPEWRNSERFAKDSDNLEKFLVAKMGYTQEEVDRIEDPRDFKIAFMAMFLHAGKTKGAQALADLKDGKRTSMTRRLKGSSRQDPRSAPGKRRQIAKRAHAKSGSEQSFADAAIAMGLVPE